MNTPATGNLGIRLQTAVCAWVVAGSAFAATVTWTGGGGGPPHNWSDAGNWSGTPTPPGTNDTAVLGGVVNRTVTVDGAGATIGALSVTADSYVIDGSPLILNAVNGRIAVTAPYIVTFNAALGGAVGVTKDNGGAALLTAASTYSGNTTVSNGVLRLGHAAALPGGVGAAGGTSLLSLRSGGVVELTGATGDFARSLGQGAHQVRITAGGFSAFGGDRDVNIGGNSPADLLTWATADFLPAANGNYLYLSSYIADSTVNIRNNILLRTAPNNANRTFYTANGSAAVDAVVSGTLSGGADSGLCKHGPGTLRLDGTNTFGGGSSVVYGTLIAHGPGSAGRWVMVGSRNNDLNSGPVAGIFSCTAAAAVSNAVALGGGTLLAANIPADGLWTVGGGAAVYGAAAEIPGAGRRLAAAQPGGVFAAGYALDNAFLQRVREDLDGVIALAAGSSNDLDFATSAGGAFANARLAAWGSPATYSGTLTPGGATYRLGGGNSMLTLATGLTGAGRALDVAMPDTYILNVPLASNLKAELLPSRHALRGHNTLTGAAGFGAYTVTTLSGAAPNGGLNAAAAIHLNGGQLILLDTTTESSGDRLPDAAAVNLNRGGTLLYTGLGGTTETAGTLNVAGGMSYLSTARAGASGTARLTFASLARADGAGASFAIGGNTALSFQAWPAVGPGGALGGWATVGLTGFAASNNNAIATLGGYVTDAPGATWDLANVQIGASQVLDTSRTIHLLRFAATSTLNLGGNTLTLNGGGVCCSGAVLPTYTNGTLTAGSGPGCNYELFFHGYNGAVHDLQAVVADNGANRVKLVKGVNGGYTNGGSTLRLRRANTYSGGTYLNHGTIEFFDDRAFGYGPIIACGYPQIDINNWNSFPKLPHLLASGTRSITNDIVANVDVLLAGGTLTCNGRITLANGATLIRNGGTVTLNGPITGAGNVKINTATTIAGTATNTYSGITAVTAGTLTLNRSGATAIPGDLYIGSNDNGAAPDNNQTFGDKVVTYSANGGQIADSAAVYFMGGGGNRAILQLNGQTETIAGLDSLPGAGIVENNHASAAVTLTLGPAAGSTNVFGGTIRNRATAGGGALALVKSGAGRQTLRGASTYTGGTAVSNGVLMVSNRSGSGTGTGSVTVAGGGALGGSGIISGTVSFDAGARLAVDLSGPGHTPLTVNSTVDLDATAVEVLLTDGYDPAPNTSWTILTAATLNGTPGAVTPPGYGVRKAGNTLILTRVVPATVFTVK